MQQCSLSKNIASSRTEQEEQGCGNDMRVLVGGLAKRIIEREQVLQGERQKGQKKRKRKERKHLKSQESTVGPLPTATSHCSFLRSVTTNVVNPGMTVNLPRSRGENTPRPQA